MAELIGRLLDVCHHLLFNVYFTFAAKLLCVVYGVVTGSVKMTQKFKF